MGKSAEAVTLTASVSRYLQRWWFMQSDGFGADRRTPTGLLQTVDRALMVLLAYERSRPDWGVTEIAAEFGWDKSSTQRLLATLASRGFLVSDAATRRYRIGPAALQLGKLWERSGSLEILVSHVLDEVSARTGDSTVLSLPDGFHMRCVLSVDGRHGQLRYYPLVGELFPAHAGATSKAYFAYLPVDQRRALFHDRPIARFTDRTVIDPEVLELEFATIREQGYALSFGEYDAGVAALAVPIFLRGEAYGSLTSCWRDQSPDVDISARLDALQEASDRLERRLSSPPVRPRPSGSIRGRTVDTVTRTSAATSP
jgi:IclR family acetate operon transcriptional repressor